MMLTGYRLGGASLRLARRGWVATIGGMLALVAVAASGSAQGTAAQRVRPAAAQPARQEVAVFSGGCFWGIQAVFEHVRGVTNATSGYTGGEAPTAEYEVVSTGSTGHAESVRVTFDPSQVTYAQLLDVFFRVAHDPTEKNRQGPDVGSQYRSAIWYTTPEQKTTAESTIRQLTASHAYARPIVTEVAPLHGFYVAEAYHQDYFVHHPDAAYIVINDKPKVEHLQHDLPVLYRDTPVLYAAGASGQ